MGTIYCVGLTFCQCAHSRKGQGIMFNKQSLIQNKQGKTGLWHKGSLTSRPDGKELNSQELNTQDKTISLIKHSWRLMN